MLYNDLTEQTKAHNKRVRVRYKLSLSESYETVFDWGLLRVLVDDLYRRFFLYYLTHKRSSKHVYCIM